MNLDQKAKTYILDCIEYDYEENPLETTEAKIKHLKQRLEQETYIRPNTTRHSRCEDWLRGVALNIAFMNYDILQLAIKWGSLPEDATERQEDKILYNYWGFMATKILQLVDGYRVPKDAAQ